MTTGLANKKESSNAAATKAVIYARVSGAKQVREGDGLASQETRCREYAGYKGYEVVRVFADDMSGKFTDRPAMKQMLGFLRQHRKANPVVVIDDISRLARGLEAHLKLRASLAAAGGKLESPSIEFGDDPDSIMVENLLATVAQHQREKNGQQTYNRMRGRMMNGYWVFHPPVGYRFERSRDRGKIIVRNEPLASIVTEALEGFACGRFESQAEVKRFFESQPAFPKSEQGKITHQRVTDILMHPLYTGHIHHEPWKLTWIKASHEPLISMQTWEKIQDRRTACAKAPARADINSDFPLRGFVLCGDCNNPFTACWSKGKLKRYPYYLCDTKGCESFRKSIPRAEIESGFEEIVHALQPSPSIFAMAREMFKAAWDQRTAQRAGIRQTLKRDLRKGEKEVETLLERIVETETPSVIKAYEKRIARLEQDMAVMNEKLASTAAPVADFDTCLEHALTFLANPWKLWASGRIALRNTVLRLAFDERIAYRRNEGYRTPKTTLPFKALGSFNCFEKDMVPHR